MATRASRAPIQRSTTSAPAPAPAAPARVAAPAPATFASLERAGALGHRLDRIPVRRPVPPAGGGAPLPGGVRRSMEAAFGEDFAAVRVHRSDAPAALGAAAFTQGTDLHFAPGRYQPGTREGRRLLGHELTHVVQQRAGRVAVPQASGAPGVNADRGLESEADTLGEKAARGEPVDVRGAGRGVQPKLLSSGPSPIQCGGCVSTPNNDDDVRPIGNAQPAPAAAFNAPAHANALAAPALYAQPPARRRGFQAGQLAVRHNVAVLGPVREQNEERSDE